MKACCAKAVLEERKSIAALAKFASTGLSRLDNRSCQIVAGAMDEFAKEINDRLAPEVAPDEERKLMERVIEAADKYKRVFVDGENSFDDGAYELRMARAQLDAYRAAKGDGK